MHGGCNGFQVRKVNWSDMHEAEKFYADINENLEEGTIANMSPYN